MIIAVFVAAIGMGYGEEVATSSDVIKNNEWTTVFKAWKGTKNSRLQAEGTGLYFFVKNNNLYYSKSEKSKATKIGLARNINYFSTDGTDVYFVDFNSYNYKSHVYLYNIKNNKLKKIKTVKEQMLGVFSAGNELGIYSNDGESMLYKLNPKENKIKTLQLGTEFSYLDECEVDGKHYFILKYEERDLYDEEYEIEENKIEECELRLYNFNDEKMTSLLKSERIYKFMTEDTENTYFATTEKKRSFIYKFDWKKRELEKVREYDEEIEVFQNEGEPELYGFSSAPNGKTRKAGKNDYDVKKGTDIPLYDFKIYSIDIVTFEKKYLKNSKMYHMMILSVVSRV